MTSLAQVSAKLRQEYWQIFDAIDTDGNGMISSRELGVALQMSEQQVGELLGVGGGKDKELDSNQFFQLMMDPNMQRFVKRNEQDQSRILKKESVLKPLTAKQVSRGPSMKDKRSWNQPTKKPISSLERPDEVTNVSPRPPSPKPDESEPSPPPETVTPTKTVDLKLPQPQPRKTLSRDASGASAAIAKSKSKTMSRGVSAFENLKAANDLLKVRNFVEFCMFALRECNHAVYDYGITGRYCQGKMSELKMALELAGDSLMGRDLKFRKEYLKPLEEKLQSMESEFQNAETSEQTLQSQSSIIRGAVQKPLMRCIQDLVRKYDEPWERVDETEMVVLEVSASQVTLPKQTIPRQRTEDMDTTSFEYLNRLLEAATTTKQDILDVHISRIAESTGAKALPQPLKPMNRLLEKCFKDYSGDFSFMCDIACGVLCVTSLSQAAACVDAIRSDRYMQILSMNNRFDSFYDAYPNGGYRDLTLTVVYSSDRSKHICEIQIILESFNQLRVENEKEIIRFASQMRLFDDCLWLREWAPVTTQLMSIGVYRYVSLDFSQHIPFPELCTALTESSCGVKQLNLMTSFPESKCSDLVAQTLATRQTNATLSTLNISFNPELTGRALEGFSKFVALQSVNLRESKSIDDDGVVALVKGCGGTLLELNMGRCEDISDISAKAIAKYCPRLLKLWVANTKVTDSGVLELSKGCCVLQLLELNGNKVTDTSISQLPVGCSQLTNIDLSWTRVTDGCVANLIQKCTLLSAIHLFNTRIGDQALAALSAHETPFKTLVLNNTQVNDNAIANVLRKHTELETIELEGTKVSDTTIMNLARCPSLEVVRVSDVGCVGDRAVVMMAECCPNLRIVDLSWTKVTDVAVTTLAEKCSKLEVLQIHHTEVTKHCVSTLREKLPELLVIN